MTFQDHTEGLDKHKPQLDTLNTEARDLDRKAALPSQTAIEQTTRNINERWNVLNTQVNSLFNFYSREQWTYRPTLMLSFTYLHTL